MTGRKCNVNCAVYGCTSVRKKNPELSFHSFPKEGEKSILKMDLELKRFVIEDSYGRQS
jgi:hypothetical protein